MWITSPANWWGWNQISSDLSQASYCLAMPPQHAFCALHSYPIILWRVEPHSLSEVCPCSHSRILLLYHWQSLQLLIRHWCHQCLPPTPLHIGNPFGMPIMPQRNPIVSCNTPDHHGQIMWDSHQVGFPQSWPHLAPQQYWQQPHQQVYEAQSVSKPQQWYCDPVLVLPLCFLYLN